MENDRFELKVNDRGYVSELYSKGDPYRMNWVIGEDYLAQTGYETGKRMFGQFDLSVDGKTVDTASVLPEVIKRESSCSVIWDLGDVRIALNYDLEKSAEQLYWRICMENKTEREFSVDDFGIWASFAYVMFRDRDVLRNIHNSAAVFPFISTDYTKLNAVRRDNTGGNLGMYQTKGRTCSIGTYCDYENLFFENVSPSLDGMLFHKLILAGGYPPRSELAGSGQKSGYSDETVPDQTAVYECNDRDWIYEKSTFTLAPGAEKVWEYVISVNDGQEDFQKKGLELGHPKVEYTPLNIINQMVRLSIETPQNKSVASAKICFMEQDERKEIGVLVEEMGGKYRIAFRPCAMGEHKVVITLSDGTEDFVVLNVMDRLDRVIDERAEYICNELYSGPDGSTPYAFEPVSHQGESLGKLNLVLKKNLLGTLDKEQVRKVEESAVYYVRPKWFMDGDFRKPEKLYGDFYRCMDFEYIAHLFFLLSEFNSEVLVLNAPETYLSWAADVFNLRVNPDLHVDGRGKEEAQMLGVYFLYFKDLLKKLKEHKMTEQYDVITKLWDKVISRIDREAKTYKAAITEHFYDNAGFGPTAGALAGSGKEESAVKYGQLLLANIGYSNDFRAQNPDRWWEALSYMIHALWGGLTAASALKVFEFLQDPEYLKAGYRATAGILYCYDTHATACLQLKKGMAASTYAVAGPHINRPDLSRERFGQSTFYRDGGIFSRLFENDSQTPDWDMGEEIVAYLDGFGRKTYIIEEEDGIGVINGSYEENDEEYLITSFAPYCSEFYLVSENRIAPLKFENGKRRITMSKERSV